MQSIRSISPLENEPSAGPRSAVVAQSPGKRKVSGSIPERDKPIFRLLILPLTHHKSIEAEYFSHIVHGSR